ncbi:hypothetical protein COW36_00545 [bacterium (Candidatus Blackallbacteria) CG17_big_fil_post_rev_8_21_14_2_50_48_46]|uniref:Uncharacterized protein n=1 Tax=bacterium (Candidatus Blackallbacteria) CG17_big_fil_post_rev_8_21_14_2_50_48_46 TaxID=2014261 RepID=A0A2M7GB13_9BACT|nr:MAG: hypothetical protein COW64_10630 [bacterium (Candidatus Blackallbacteria) CG18_big_fil_WC_8_21_14_2_50_49_26]PIW19361.1 MAG: hypothetical protein COW36_00545 [bacterium (Candidatus Blackallbacteria) CG17_big_fil_post_rev_8_21_14_2_50_48_46]PIW49035.1 MAG: hypothetical protein COW20_07910 [bacterium (Candidatus Blackallbacteria) CG13_big_fil_rev_8_21_14_2_50_49_14]
MKRSSLYTMLALSCSLLFSATAQAETGKTEKKPVQTESTFRFIDPNPAATANFGWGRFRLPSVRVDIGSSVPVDKSIQDFTSLGKSIATLTNGLLQGQTIDSTTATNTKNQINTALAPFQSGVRMDYETEIALFSFAGAPVQGLQIANRPITLGFNIGAETRGYVNAKFSQSFSEGLTTLTDSIPTLLSTGSSLTSIVSDAQSLTGKVTQLTSDITQLTAQGTQLVSNPLSATPQQIADIQTLTKQVSTNVDQLITPARQLTKTVTDATSTTRGLLNTIQGAASGGVSVDSANDLHMTLALSGAYPVYETEDVKISVGTNLKLFLMPFNVPFRSLGLNSDSSIMGQIKVTDFSGLQNIDSVKTTLDSLDKAATDTNTLITQAESVKSQLDTAIQGISTGNLAAVATEAQKTLTAVNQTSQSLQTTQSSINAALQNVNNIQQTLLSELQNTSLKGSIVTPGGAGFGMDLGVSATLYRNLKLNLLLQNPVVVWQGTERPFEARFANAQGQMQPSLNFLDDQAKSVNYNATVPMALLMNGQYSFDELLPHFSGLIGKGQFEFVNNGRTPALTLGVQKQFGPAYAGLGGRIGGITSMLYGEAGLRLAGNFGLDFQLGVSPTGTGIPAPGMSWLNSALLGLYLQF